MERPEKESPPATVAEEPIYSSNPSNLDVKGVLQEKATDVESGGLDRPRVLENAADIVGEVLAVEDDPAVSPWTVRMVFLGVYKLMK